MEKSKRPRKSVLDNLKDTVIGKKELSQKGVPNDQHLEQASDSGLPPIQNDASGQPSFNSLLARQREVRKAKALKLKAKADGSTK